MKKQTEGLLFFLENYSYLILVHGEFYPILSKEYVKTVIVNYVGELTVFSVTLFFKLCFLLIYL